jgi:hypothetical protein
MKIDGPPRLAVVEDNRTIYPVIFPCRRVLGGWTKAATGGHVELAGEMSHRVQNLFAIFGGMVRVGARSAFTPQEMSEILSGRGARPRRAKQDPDCRERGDPS